MNRRTVIAGSRQYTFASDDAPPLAARWWGVVSASLVDEITDQSPAGEIAVTTDRRGLMPRTGARDGLAGLVGIPARVFPGLRTHTYQVDFGIDVDGYLPLRERVDVPADPAFPATFTPVDLGRRGLRRPPVVLHGRTSLNGGATVTPLPGATVSVTDVWWTTAETVGAPRPANLVALRPPLAIGRDDVTGALRGRVLMAISTDDKTLLTEARPGATTLALSNGINLAAGDVLWIDREDGERMEYAPVLAVSLGATADQPATVMTAHPLVAAHRPGATVRRTVPAPMAGTPVGLTRAAAPGDTSIFLANLTGLSATTTVEANGGGSSEFHRVLTYTAMSDPRGYFRLPPIARVARVRVAATHPAHGTVVRAVSPRYGEASNRVDFEFR